MSGLYVYVPYKDVNCLAVISAKHNMTRPQERLQDIDETWRHLFHLVKKEDWASTFRQVALHPALQVFLSKNKENFNPEGHKKSTTMQITNLPCTPSPAQVRGNATWEQTDGQMGCSWLNHRDDSPAWSWPASFLSLKGREKTKPGDGPGFLSEETLPPPLKQYPGPDVVHKGFCRGHTPDLVKKCK